MDSYQTEPATSSHAPGVSELLDAVAGLRAPAGGVGALGYLALPVAEVAGVALRVMAGRLYWRDVSVPDRTDQLGRAGALVELVAAGRRAEDVFFALGGGPAEAWVRIARSGSRWCCFGAEVLVGCPAVSVDAALSWAHATAAFTAAVRAWRAGADLAREVLVGCGAPVGLKVHESSWELLRLTLPARVPVVGHVPDPLEVAGPLGLGDARAVTPGVVVGTLGAFEAMACVSTTAGALTVRHPDAGTIVPSFDALTGLPEGWEASGRVIDGSHRGAWVLRHVGSCAQVLARPAPVS